MHSRAFVPTAASLAALASGLVLASASAHAQTTVLDGAQPPPRPASTSPAPASGEAGASASAGASGGASASVAPATEAPRWGHRNQLEIRAAVSEGYQLGIRYATGDPCNPGGDHFCPMRSPVMVDTAIGFGVTQTIEIEGRFRLGEPGWNTTVPLAAGIGARFYGDEFSRFKFFGAIAALVDFTAVGNASSYGTDIQARGEVGLHYDVVRQFAVYFQVGATAGFLRALTLAIDGGLGFQVRVP